MTLTWAPDGDDPHAWNVYKRGARVHWENLPDRGLVATLDGSARGWTDTEASDEWTVYHVKAVNTDGTESHPAKSKVKKVKR